MYHFIAVFYYFSIVRIPSKAYYWSGKKYTPRNDIVNSLEMTQGQLYLLWRNIHIQDVNEFYNIEEYWDE